MQNNDGRNDNPHIINEHVDELILQELKKPFRVQINCPEMIAFENNEIKQHYDILDCISHHLWGICPTKMYVKDQTKLEVFIFDDDNKPLPILEAFMIRNSIRICQNLPHSDHSIGELITATHIFFETQKELFLEMHEQIQELRNAMDQAGIPPLPAINSVSFRPDKHHIN